MTGTTAKLQPILPLPGSKNGWRYKKFLRIGQAKARDEKREGFDLYGVYGTRQTADEWDLFIQYEGRSAANGSTVGMSLASASADWEVYFWASITPFAEINIFDARGGE